MKSQESQKTDHCATGPRLAITYRKVSELKLDAKNPRKHTPHQIAQIARSMQQFGFVSPILINRLGTVVAGHGRLLACEKLGWPEAPTIPLDHLTEAQARAYMIADNRLTENSQWDDQLLALQLKELSDLDLDFTLDITGFEMPEIDLRIEQLNSPDDDDERADQIPENSDGPVVTRPGDEWILNQHRVSCGSALDVSALEHLLGNRSAEMVFVDPPYNVKIGGNVSGLGAVKHGEFQMASGEMSEKEFRLFLTTALSNLARFSDNRSIHYVCMDWRHAADVIAAGKSVYPELLNVCVWVKDRPGMGSLYRSQHEFVFVFKRGKGSHRNNVQLGQYGRNRSNVWNYQCASSFSRSSDEGNLIALHPTVKPTALVADAIMDCTERNGIVLDTFLGSGTTVLAAERTGRRCFGLELDPHYVDVIVRRWQAFTRGKAIHAQSTRPFDEIEHEVKGKWDSATTDDRPSPNNSTK
jgi:DNA modification methylase